MLLRLKFERTKRGLSQAAIAAIADTHQPTITLIEQGRRLPPAEHLERLARAFGVPPEALLVEVSQ